MQLVTPDDGKLSETGCQMVRRPAAAYPIKLSMLCACIEKDVYARRNRASVLFRALHGVGKYQYQYNMLNGKIGGLGGNPCIAQCRLART